MVVVSPSGSTGGVTAAHVGEEDAVTPQRKPQRPCGSFVMEEWKPCLMSWSSGSAAVGLVDI